MTENNLNEIDELLVGWYVFSRQITIMAMMNAKIMKT